MINKYRQTHTHTGTHTDNSPGFTTLFSINKSRYCELGARTELIPTVRDGVEGLNGSCSKQRSCASRNYISSDSIFQFHKAVVQQDRAV